ncbi:hypothetical protein BJX64DRAFT_43607 [Aspergillus heterothallicus]
MNIAHKPRCQITHIFFILFYYNFYRSYLMRHPAHVQCYFPLLYTILFSEQATGGAKQSKVKSGGNCFLVIGTLFHPFFSPGNILLPYSHLAHHFYLRVINITGRSGSRVEGKPIQDRPHISTTRKKEQLREKQCY